MIIVYASSKGLTPQMRSVLNSQKAKKQKRLSNGRFAASIPKVEDNPLVSFYYPSHGANVIQGKLMIKRTVRLISSTGTHYTGLEKQANGKWQFKKYLAPKAEEFKIVSFNPTKMS